MIPKVIHYCWFGHNPLPVLAKKCIASWKKHLPDYNIIEWNENNFDIHCIPYVEQAYEAKKYAFVSDYARFQILYHYGGIYMDTDVEVIKSLDDLLAYHAFAGFEQPDKVAPGLILATEKGNHLIKEMLDGYTNRPFIFENGEYNLKTVVEYTTEILMNNGLQPNGKKQTVNNMEIFPVDYFCPMEYSSGKLSITPNTYSIHHFSASWYSPSQKFKLYLERYFGKRFLVFLSKIKRIFK